LHKNGVEHTAKTK